MKRWPMLMRGPLVKAALAGTKTVTRRLDHGWSKAKPGDLIWVKETWAVDESLDLVLPSDLAMGVDVEYLADGARSVGRASFDRGKTRVSIHMPVGLSRLWLEVVSVRQEHLWDVTEEDARREGFSSEPVSGTVNGQPAQVAIFEPRRWFAAIWEAINGDKPGCRWLDNPMVVRVELRRGARPKL